MTKRTFFPGWTVVIGSGVGVAFGSAVFFSQGFALLSAAIGAQFGWTQSDLAKAATIFLLLQTAMFPVCGWFLDRWGSRKFAMTSIVMFAISLVVLSRIANSLPQYYLAFALVGLVSAGTNVISYARAITKWFDRKRGLALGVAASFQAIGAFMIPVLMQRIIGQSGWPNALLALAGFEVIVCLPLVAIFVKDGPASYGLLPDGDRTVHATASQAIAATRVDSGEIMRNLTFWKLAAAFAIMGMSFFAVQANVAFILTKSAGLSLTQVAMIQGLTGVATLFGRVGFGFLLDRFHAPVIGGVSLLFMATYFSLYASSSALPIVAIAAVLAGVAVGGEGDLMPYLAGRYFGTEAVSRIFGWFLCAFFVGGAVGPVAFARASIALNGSTIPLYALAALQIVPVAMFLSLGAYRDHSTTAMKETEQSAVARAPG